jgi:hypothetical protein
MPATREQVMVALSAMLTSLGVFTTVSRRNRSPESITPAMSPAIFVLEHAEDYQVQAEVLPPVRHLNVSLVLYNDVGADPNAIPATAINNALDALDGALKQRDGTGRYTLGGLVYSLVASGAVEKAPGDKTGKGLAVVPLAIILP